MLSIKTSGSVSKILVAGMGNVLRGDDGFGVEVAKKLAEEKLPEGVDVMEAGIAGISLVQKLFDVYDVLVILDTMKRGGSPGSIYVVEPEIPKVGLDTLDMKLVNYLADAHYVEPSKVLTLAKGLGVLPKKVLIVGCEPSMQEKLNIGLTAPVKEAADKAVGIVLDLLRQELGYRAAIA
ncbi:MAG: hydrogenase maturation protease [Nitrososphaerales archaeon]|nr:hydrogenase maturation protease [Nitrososphaerales archaeon]